MSEIAKVLEVVPSHAGGADSRVAIDIVKLLWSGKLYTWNTERGKYRIGQKVNINPPANGGSNITPA